MGGLALVPLTEENLPLAQAIDRDDVSGAFVDSADAIWELTRWGQAHGCVGHTFLVMYTGRCIGLILLGEAIPWASDPPEMAARPFYRLMGFVLDRRYRGRGLGGQVLEMAIARCFRDFGPRSIALGVHRDNLRAGQFYRRHGFVQTRYMEGDDFYYLKFFDPPNTERYPIS